MGPLFKIFISADKLQVELELAVLPPPIPDSEDTIAKVRHDIQQELQKLKICFGMDNKKIDELLSLWQQDGKACKGVIAIGKAPEHGIAAEVKPLVSVHRDIGAEHGDKVDYKEKNYLTNVEAHTLLLQVQLATLGVDGQNVLGEIVKAKSGQVHRTIKITPGVEKKQDEKFEYYTAKQEGIFLQCNEGMIELVQEYTLNQDVDLRIGNLEVFGDLKLSGSIQPGYKVKVKGSLFIKGLIESAYVEVGKSLLSEGGILGKKGAVEVKVGEDLKCNFAEHATLHVGGSVVVKSSLVNSEVYCGGSLEIQQGKGVILSSKVVCGDSIKALEIGSIGEEPVRLQVGANPKTWLKIRRSGRQLNFMSKKSRRGISFKSASKQSKKNRSSLLRKMAARRSVLIQERIFRRYQSALFTGSAAMTWPYVWVEKKIFPKVGIYFTEYSWNSDKLMQGPLKIVYDERVGKAKMIH